MRAKCDCGAAGERNVTLRVTSRLSTVGETRVHDPEDIPAIDPAPVSVGRTSGSLQVSVVWLRDIAVAAVVSLVIILFLYQPVRVEGTSMVPMLQDDDRLFINKLAYHVGSIQCGDVVVFRYPRDLTRSYIKRVIGLPGDHIRIEHGRVFRNEKELAEAYVPVRYADERSEPEVDVPAGDFYVMGDHRSVSYDSRDFGPVPRGLIYGKAAFVYWPFREAGVVH